ncbi:TolC family protein [Sphingobacterium sp. DN00404]|uniref:TolC family protein n=1 Tax=Sphingobacterium micropteri TaxID=2763501 RepID=A0ABR7YN93_9SPHI|nr:TolC family protein [Sphingobacterium micropteri]MBD1432790.1 TolC family protein [Sphingobacterium micropteri]
MNKFLIVVFLLLSTVFRGFGQLTPSMLEAIDYTKIALPPLEELFENAKKSPSVEMYEAKMETQDNQLITEKRSWLKYFRVGGSWQYGNIAINSAFTNEYTPLFYQSSGVTQSSWYSTAGIAIPLDDLFDRGNRVKRQKMERRSTELEMEKWFDEQKIRIINSYVKVINAVSILQKKMESLTMATTQLKMVENDFTIGHALISDLHDAKKMELEAFEAYKLTQTTITSEILNLEILSKTKIISK